MAYIHWTNDPHLMLCFHQVEPKGLGNKRQKWNHLLSPSLLVTDLQNLWSSSIQLFALLRRGPGSWAGTPGTRGHSKGSTEPEGLTTSWSLRLVLVIDEQGKEPSHSTGRNGQPYCHEILGLLHITVSSKCIWNLQIHWGILWWSCLLITRSTDWR